MIATVWKFLRHRLVQLAMGYPPLIAALMFPFLFTVSNHIYSASQLVLPNSSFQHMLTMGTLMATFGALFFYEVLRLYRRLSEVQFVRTVASTMHHEINNPLNVIVLSVEKLKTLNGYDEATIRNILTSSERIRDVVAKLSELEEQVHRRQDGAFAELIDLHRSR